MLRNSDFERPYAVLTGDLIESSQFSVERLNGARDALEEIVHKFEGQFPGSVAGHSEFFRGDSWQVGLNRPEMALRLAVYVRAVLKADADVDTRIAIGIGAAEDIVPGKISLSTGDAFMLSGRALDKMTSYFDLTGALHTGTGPMREWLPVLLHLCSDLIRQWTRRQAEIVAKALALDIPDHETIARSLTPSVAKQTVTKSLQGANWRGIRDALKVFETTDWAGVINTY